MQTIVEAKNLRKYFPMERGIFRKRVGFIKAVDGVSLQIKKGEILGLVGESGCGKTTTAKLLIDLIKPDAGSIKISGVNILDKSKKISLEKKAQIIFQDPFDSLNPRMKIENIILEGVDIFRLYSGQNRIKRLRKLLSAVGLPFSSRDKYPHQFSGGERQKIGIARALSVEPEFIVCDEPVSSLDVSIRAQVLNLLKDLQGEFNLSYLFISHDLNVVRFISDRIVVMYKGKIVEEAKSRILYRTPLHPYTKYLLSANLSADPEQRHKRFSPGLKERELQSKTKGCIFYPLCPHPEEVCLETTPSLQEVEPQHFVACHFYKNK